MTSTRSLFYILIATAAASGCGAADTHRRPQVDGGADGGETTPSDGGKSGTGGTAGTGGKSSTGGTGGKSSTGGTANGAPDAGVSPADASVVPTDASASDTDASDAGSPGPVLGEYCEFANADLESYVRNELSNLSTDGGPPSGPIRVTDARGVTSLELFCDCSDTLDLAGAECLTGLTSVTVGQDLDNFGSLASLKNLTDISFEYISEFPSGFSSLTHVRKIDTHITGFSDLSELGQMPLLEDLEMSGNQLTDIGPLSGSTNLKILNVNSNQITSLAPLAGLRKLEELNAGYNPITDLTPLTNIKSLVRLELSQITVTDISALQGLTNLALVELNGVTGLKDFSPLVANTGIGSGDEIYAQPSAADCASFKADAKTLTDRGVTLYGFPTCP